MAKRRAGSRSQRKTARAIRPTKKRPAKSRAKRVLRTADAQSDWNPSRFALWSQRWGNPGDDNQTYPTTVLLRHPSAPFVGTGTISNFEYDLQETAHNYLVAANSNQLIDPPLGLPQEWLDALKPGPASDPSFGWLKFEGPATPLLSFSALRTNASDAGDLMVILLASQPTGPGFGIRVVAHVLRPRSRSSSGSELEIHISGMSASLPGGRWLPQPVPRTATARRGEVARALIPDMIIELFKLAPFRTAIASTVGLEENTLAVQGVRLPPTIRSGQRLTC